MFCKLVVGSCDWRSYGWNGQEVGLVLRGVCVCVKLS